MRDRALGVLLVANYGGGRPGYDNRFPKDGTVWVGKNDRDVGINWQLRQPDMPVFIQTDGVVDAEYRVESETDAHWVLKVRSCLKTPLRTSMQRTSYRTERLIELTRARRRDGQ